MVVPGKALWKGVACLRFEGDAEGARPEGRGSCRVRQLLSAAGVQVLLVVNCAVAVFFG